MLVSLHLITLQMVNAQPSGDMINNISNERIIVINFFSQVYLNLYHSLVCLNMTSLHTYKRVG